MATGMRTTYTDTGRIRRIIDTAIVNIDWTEAPLLKMLGMNNGGKFNIAQAGTKIEWMEDTMSPRSTTIAEDLDTSETGVDVATGHGDYFKAGDVVKVGTEIMYVSSVSSDTLTVVRGVNNSGTGIAATNGDAIEIVTHASLEGGNYVLGHTTNVTLPYNHSQILREAISVSGTEKANPKWDMADTMTYHMNKLIGNGGKAGKLPILLEQTFKDGYRAAGSSSVARMMGGFDTYVTSNVTALGGAPLTRKHLDDLMQTCFEAGGSPETLIVPGWAKRKITSFYEKYITTPRSEKMGGGTIEKVVTDFGEMEVVYWRWCPTNTLYLIEKNKMGWVTLKNRGFDVYDRASTGDYDIKEVLGEFSFVLKAEKSHGKISGFSTTS